MIRMDTKNMAAFQIVLGIGWSESTRFCQMILSGSISIEEHVIFPGDPVRTSVQQYDHRHPPLCIALEWSTEFRKTVWARRSFSVHTLAVLLSCP
ncbi:hypothetical protein OGAPHI_005445 [Ogataea philodendri]|uniref:Uncharacterized protein n=1 Tax=Ogataea philodendri TaxID=1378263 RepID=A0A9P8NZ70_9ASCO|nr:uncharacterized protein OGAPHI_005445 [Ogataea philodendri]KAH3662197.1 hypothetical protein OGAPHI_005445 [Ogataea philodendri]